MNAVTAELFAINEDILEGGASHGMAYHTLRCIADDYIDDDDDDDVDPSAAAIEDDFFRNNRSTTPVEYSSEPTDSRRGPYSDILQDFYIRSYMSGGRKSKSSAATMGRVDSVVMVFVMLLSLKCPSLTCH